MKTKLEGKEKMRGKPRSDKKSDFEGQFDVADDKARGGKLAWRRSNPANKNEAFNDVNDFF